MATNYKIPGSDPLLPGGAAGSFSIGGALSRAFGVFVKRLPVILLIMVPAGAVQLLPLLVSSPTVLILVSILVNLLTLVLASAVVLLTFRTLRHETADVAQSISAAASRFLPVLGAALLASIAIGIGTLLLVVPGLIIMTMLYVATPSIVVERLGGIAGLQRSMQLTAGFRWHIFAVVVILWVIGFAIGWLAAQIFGLTMLFSVVMAAVTVVLSGFGAVVSSVVYHDLRVAKDGVNSKDLLELFA